MNKDLQERNEEIVDLTMMLLGIMENEALDMANFANDRARWHGMVCFSPHSSSEMKRIMMAIRKLMPPNTIWQWVAESENG